MRSEPAQMLAIGSLGTCDLDTILNRLFLAKADALC